MDVRLTFDIIQKKKKEETTITKYRKKKTVNRLRDLKEEMCVNAEKKMQVRGKQAGEEEEEKKIN